MPRSGIHNEYLNFLPAEQLGQLLHPISKSLQLWT